MINIEHRENGRRMVVEGEMTIYTAAELKEELMSSLKKVPDFTMDLSLVTEIDSAGLQLLLLAKREAEVENVSLRLTNVSAAVEEVLALSGLEKVFDVTPHETLHGS